MNHDRLGGGDLGVIKVLDIITGLSTGEAEVMPYRLLSVWDRTDSGSIMPIP